MWICNKWADKYRKIERGAKEKVTVEDLLKLMLNFFQEIDKEIKESYEKLSILDLKTARYIALHRSYNIKCKWIQ